MGLELLENPTNVSVRTDNTEQVICASETRPGRLNCRLGLLISLTLEDRMLNRPLVRSAVNARSSRRSWASRSRKTHRMNLATVRRGGQRL